MIGLFHYLSLLNLFDAFVTYYGLENGLITEMNPFMDNVYQKSSSFFIVLKVSLSFFLYLFIILKLVPSSPFVKGMALVASGLYTTVFALHCIWLFGLA